MQKQGQKLLVTSLKALVAPFQHMFICTYFLLSSIRIESYFCYQLNVNVFYSYNYWPKKPQYEAYLMRQEKSMHGLSSPIPG